MASAHVSIRNREVPHHGSESLRTSKWIIPVPKMLPNDKPLLMEEILHHLLYKTSTGINCQPQLGSAGFLPSTVWWQLMPWDHTSRQKNHLQLNLTDLSQTFYCVRNGASSQLAIFNSCATHWCHRILGERLSGHNWQLMRMSPKAP